MWDNVFLVAFVLWPGVVLVAALLNMLLVWTFSWSELVMDYLIGIVIGVSFHFGTVGEVSAIEHFFLMVSTGLPGLLKWGGVAALQEPQALFLVTAGAVVAATLITGALDRAVLAIGTRMSVGGGLLSLLILPFKLPFALITTAIGLLIGVIGLIVGLVNRKGKLGFLGGVPYVEWGLPGHHATTFGAMVNVFCGPTHSVLAHELYHTRQYIYLHDWLGVFYFTIAGLWGLISSAAGRSFDVSYFYRASRTREIGNPIECVPYRRFG